MRNRLLTYLAFIAFFSLYLISCKAQSENHIDIEKLNKDLPHLKISPVTAYYPDSLIMLYSKNAGSNDTSWTMAAFKVDSFVIIKLNEFTPKIMAENFSITPDSLGFINFNGYICKLPLDYWNEIITDSGLDTYIAKDSLPSTKLHGTSYTLHFRNKRFVDSDDDFPFMKKVDKIFTTKIIDKIHYRAAHTPSHYESK